jgi:protein-disulfide isomerase
MKKILLALLFFVTLQGAGMAASAQPDSDKNPILAALQKAGAKFYYLGNRSGMDGWFIVKEGQVQIAYATPDNKNIVIGALFGQDGENVTALQVSTLVQTNKDFAQMMTNLQKEQTAFAQGNGQSSAPPTPQSIGNMPAASTSPGERLIQDLSSASTIMVGKASAPEILMVMDPRCPHCQATFRALRDSLSRGDLHLRLIPIGPEDSENERAAAILLGTPDPFMAWSKYMGGDVSALAGTPSDAAVLGVRANHQVIDDWKIENTPYLVYRAKDGKIKVLQGEPKIPVLLKDLGL